MFSPRWRKLFRDLWLHKSRSLLVVLAIAIGIAGSGIVLDAWALVEVATRDGYLASNPSSATLRTEAIDADLLARVRGLPEIADAQARRTVIARAQTEGAWRTAMLFVYQDFSAIRIGIIKPEIGQWPPADGALVIERSSLDFSGAGVGTTLALDTGRQGAATVSLLVTGVARDVGLAPGWMEHVVYGFMNTKTAVQLGAPASLNELQITVHDQSLDREGVRRIAYQVKALIEQSGRPVTNVQVPEPGEHVHAAQMDSLLLTQGAFGVLALLLSGFLVVNLFVAMLAGQVREIGVMKAIGARPGQIAVMYLGVALVLGLVATALAVPVARALGIQYAALKADLLNFDITGFSVPWWVIGLQVAAGLLVPLGAASIPVVRGCRISVSAALRDVGIDATAPSTGGALLRMGGLSRPLMLSLRNAFRRRQRMVLTLTTLAVGGAVFLGARNLDAAIRASVDLLFASQRYDVTLVFAEPHQPDSIEATIRRVPGVDAAEGWAATRAAFTQADGTLGNTFQIAAPPATTRLLALPLVAGRWLNAGDRDALVVSRSMLREDSTLAVGRSVSVVVGGRTAQWTIVGMVNAGPTAVAYAPREVIAGLVAEGRVDRAAVRLGGRDEIGATSFAIIQQLRSELGAAGLEVSNSQLLEENRRVIEDHLLMVAQFLGAMAWLMVVVGGLGLASTMSLSVLERTREIGVMRAIGARHGAILGLVQVEGLVIALLGWALALPLSLPVSVTLGRVFGRVMLPVADRFIPEASGVMWWLLLVIVVSVLACAWPALRALRVPTRAALAYE